MRPMCSARSPSSPAPDSEGSDRIRRLHPHCRASGANISGVHTALAVAAALVALAFAMSTFERWLTRRRRHEFAWSVALAMFALASASLAAGAQLGWTGPTF